MSESIETTPCLFLLHDAGNKRQHHLLQHLLIQLVLAVKALALWIVLAEESVGIA